MKEIKNATTIKTHPALAILEISSKTIYSNYRLFANKKNFQKKNQLRILQKKNRTRANKMQREVKIL